MLLYRADKEDKVGNEDYLSNAIANFYSSIKDTRGSKSIKIRRITNTEKIPKEESSMTKQKLIKKFSHELQMERKALKESIFKAKRNLAKPADQV